MSELAEYRQRLLERYGEQPVDLAATIESLADRLDQPLALGEWSPYQVLAHVEAAERLAFHPRLHRILTEDQPAIDNWDESDWMENEYDANVPYAQLMESVLSLRVENLGRLNGISAETWSRTGTHQLRGERTLQYWVEYAVAHVNDHLDQLSSG
jgi:hypothetical protein